MGGEGRWMGGGVTVDWWRSAVDGWRSDSGWVEEWQWMVGGVIVNGWRSDDGWVEE